MKKNIGIKVLCTIVFIISTLLVTAIIPHVFFTWIFIGGIPSAVILLIIKANSDDEKLIKIFTIIWFVASGPVFWVGGAMWTVYNLSISGTKAVTVNQEEQDLRNTLIMLRKELDELKGGF
jgi:hypothetical protein